MSDVKTEVLTPDKSQLILILAFGVQPIEYQALKNNNGQSFALTPSVLNRSASEGNSND